MNINNIAADIAMEIITDNFDFFLIKLGMAIQESMQKAGVTFDEVADKVGYSQRDFHRVLEGRLLMTPTDLKTIAKICRVSADDLMKYNPPCSNSVLKILEIMNDIADLQEEVIKCNLKNLVY